MSGDLVFSLIAAAGSIAAIIFGVIAYKRAEKKDAYSDGDQDGTLRGDIKYMRNGFDDLRLDVREVARKQDTQNERLIRCEESTKQAHKRIDSLETKRKGGGRNDGN